IALVEVVAIRDGVLAAQLVIYAANAVPEVRRPRDRDSYIGDLDWNAVNRDVLNILIIRHGALDIRKETERSKSRFTCGGRLAYPKRHRLQRSIPNRRGNRCRRGIGPAWCFSSPVCIQ